MIVQSFRHVAWPVLLACMSAVACSKKPANEDAFVSAHLGPNSSNLCPLGTGTPVLMVGALQNASLPETVPNGQGGLDIDCQVSPNGSMYDLHLAASVPGNMGGELIITGSVDATTGGTVSAQFLAVSGAAGTTYAANDDCTLTYSFMGMALPSGQSGISAGSIFAHIDCPDAVNMGGSVSGVQVTTEDGGFSNAMCEGTADFFFQNCSQ
jgi:hypothetical protein